MTNLSKNIAALAASAAMLGAEAGAQVRHGDRPGDGRSGRDSRQVERDYGRFNGGDFSLNRNNNIILIRDAGSLQSALSAVYGGYGFADQEARDQRMADAQNAIHNLSRNNYVFAIDDYDRPVAFRLTGGISNRLESGEYAHLDAERIDDPATVYDLARQHYNDIIALRDLTRRAPGEELNRGYFGVLEAQSERDNSAFAYNSRSGEALIYSPRAAANPSAALDGYLAFHQRLMRNMEERLPNAPQGHGQPQDAAPGAVPPGIELPNVQPPVAANPANAAQMPDFSRLSLEQKVQRALELYNQIPAAESAVDALREAFRDTPIQFPNGVMTLAESEADYRRIMQEFLKDQDMNPALPGIQGLPSDQTEGVILRGLRLRAANDFGPYFDNQENPSWNEAQRAALDACAEREDYFYPDASLGLFDANLPQLGDNSPYDAARRDFMILTMDGQVMQGLGEAIAAQNSNQKINAQIEAHRSWLKELQTANMSLRELIEQKQQTYASIEAGLQAVLNKSDLRDDPFRKELRAFLVGDATERREVTLDREDILGFLRRFAAANPDLPENSPARPILADVARYDDLGNQIGLIGRRLNENNRSR